MAIQVINVGSSANSGGGDPLRSAMIKINDNFAELYRRTGGEQAQTIIGADSTVLVDGPNSSLNANALSGTVPTDLISFSDLANPPDTIAGFGITDAYTKIQVYTKPEVDDLLLQSNDLKGTLVGDDSTVLIDGVNSTINAAALTGALPAIDGSALTGITATANNLVGDMKGSVYADDSTLLVDGVNGTINSSALTKPISFNDDEKAIFGTGDDLQIWHNGSTSIIQNATGQLQLRGNTIRLLNAATTEDLAFFNADGSVDLYYDNNKKFETTTDGVAITGRITGLTDPVAAQDAATKAYVDANSGGGGGGTVDMQGSVFADDSTLLVDGVAGTINSSALTKPIALADDEKITFGDGDDLQLYHSGGINYVDGTGSTIIRGNWLYLRKSGSTENYFIGKPDGAVELYYDNVKKLETTADGISVTDHIALADDGELRLGTGNDMQISHTGTNGLIKSVTGSLVLQGSTVRIQDGGSSQTAISASDGIATLLFENSAKLATSTDGVAVTGKITGLTDPTNAQDAATKAYVDASVFDGAFGSLSGTPTTLAGYGITDAATTNNMAPTGAVDFTGATTIDFNTVTINNLEFADISAKPTTIAGYGITDAFDGAFSSLSGKPTTLGGYGITDAVDPNTETTFTKDVHFDQGVEEKFQTLTGQSGVVQHNWNDGHVFYHTTPAGDITANFINVNLTAEYATNVTIIINQGATPYEVTAVQIAGSGQTINWQGGSAPTGNANGIDAFSFTILNDGGSYVVLGQMVDFT